MKKNLFNNIFKYKEQEEYEFVLSDAQNNLDEKEFTDNNNRNCLFFFRRKLKLSENQI